MTNELGIGLDLSDSPSDSDSDFGDVLENMNFSDDQAESASHLHCTSQEKGRGTFS